MWLYSVSSKQKLHVFDSPSVVWSVAFTALPTRDATTPATVSTRAPRSKHFALAMGGEDKAVTVWAGGKLNYDGNGDAGAIPEGVYRRLLRISRPKDVNAIAFSKDAICIASGNKVYKEEEHNRWLG